MLSRHIKQEVCPFNVTFSEPSSEPSYAARGPGQLPFGIDPDPTMSSDWHPGTASPSLVDLFLTASERAQRTSDYVRVVHLPGRGRASAMPPLLPEGGGS